MNVLIGKYDHVCTLFTPINTTNASSGEVVTTYSGTATATVFCYVNNRANNEVFNDLQRQDNTTITIDCRYNDIDSLSMSLEWIFKIDGQTFQVNSISEADEYGRKNVYRLTGIERIG
jgi:SPP1 family predicted phage head-tail adaptor